MSAGSKFVPDPSWPSIVELAIEVWGQPTERTPKEWRWGRHGSKAVRLADNIWNDHENNTGGGYLGMWQLARHDAPLPGKPKHANGHAGRVPPWDNIGKRYPYLDAAGHLVMEVIRTITGSPRFVQRRPDPSNQSGWKWSVKDIPVEQRPLYRLPELIASNAEFLFICEGEKDADNLAAKGLIATTNVGGAGKWRPEYGVHFAGRHVVVLPDCDLAGRNHAATVAASLAGVAASVRILELPDLQPKGDVSDWLAAGGDAETLERLARDIPVYVPPPPEDTEEPPDGWDIDVPLPGGPSGPGGGGTQPDEPPEIPMINCRAGELPRMIRAAQAALVMTGAALYQRGMLVQPTESEYTAADGSVTHSASLVPVTAPALLKLMAQSAIWRKWDGRVNGGQGDYVVCDPPDKLVAIVLNNRGDWPFPVVRGVLTCPTMRPDGSLLIRPGYDPVSRFYLMFPQGLEIPSIPANPSKEDARKAFERLDKLLDGYPFVSKISRSVAQAMLMTQVLRCAMPVSPLLAVSAKAPGTGKSHLVDLASAISIGRPCPAMGTGKKDEETEKGINTMLIAGVPGFSIDNVSRDIDTPVLNMATERSLITIRLFGVLEGVEVENAVTIFMTGNNLAIIDEQGRRTMRCDLDAGLERPERREFEGGDPIYAVRANRGQYIADILAIARAYHLSGERVAPFSIGSYGAWSHFVREPIFWLTGHDPADTMDEARKDDPVTMKLHALVAGWWQDFGGEALTVADAVVRSKTDGFLLTMKEHFPSRGGAEVDTARFGYWLRRFVGRVANGKRFVRDEGETHGTARWKIVCV
jgi:putative DNA primase/helicase